MVSFYIESLTNSLVDKAKDLIVEIDRAGGIGFSYVETGKPKAAVEDAAAHKQTSIDRGETVIVGVNKYKLSAEEELETLEVDNHKGSTKKPDRTPKTSS